MQSPHHARHWIDNAASHVAKLGSSVKGQGLPSRLRWQYVRCSPDCRRPVASRNSAANHGRPGQIIGHPSSPAFPIRVMRRSCPPSCKDTRLGRRQDLLVQSSMPNALSPGASLESSRIASLKSATAQSFSLGLVPPIGSTRPGPRDVESLQTRRPGYSSAATFW